MPVQNIIPMLTLYGTLAWCLRLIWETHKEDKHARGIARVRRCEIRRKAMFIVEQGRKSRAERMKAYHG